MPTIKQIDRCLPQTQCTQCSYPGCQEYAAAIHAGQADINQCPPGGEITINALAVLLNRPAKPLNTDFGKHSPRQIAKIVEKDCIGCMLCIQACPVDAIMGCNKFMHSVIDNECTGCELCLPACPMDCIEMIPPKHKPSAGPWPYYSNQTAEQARKRRQNRLARLARDLDKRKSTRYGAQMNRKQAIREAVARARDKRT